MRTSIQLAVMVCLAGRLAAQCPDGTPRPCSNSRNAAAKRVETLDDRTWIVVPFKNVSKDAEIDWLRDGSVDLLSRDLSQWQDVRTVDDRRVADFLREMPTARGGQALSLNDGLGVARRAGAGRLVMGDLLRLGRRARSAFLLHLRRLRHLPRQGDRGRGADGPQRPVGRRRMRRTPRRPCIRMCRRGSSIFGRARSTWSRSCATTWSAASRRRS